MVKLEMIGSWLEVVLLDLRRDYFYLENHLFPKHPESPLKKLLLISSILQVNLDMDVSKLRKKKINSTLDTLRLLKNKNNDLNK